MFLGEISELMINNAAVRKQYSKLVPGDVSHKLFWARYFYKVGEECAVRLFELTLEKAREK